MVISRYNLGHWRVVIINCCSVHALVTLSLTVTGHASLCYLQLIMMTVLTSCDVRELEAEKCREVPISAYSSYLPDHDNDRDVKK